MSAELSNRLHGSWMWYRSSENKKWSPVWSVLRHQILFFFTSQETCMENHIGTLHLTKDNTFHYGQGDPKDGYRFELHCGKRKTKFRVKTVYERELWRAYMEGVITGKVPQGVVLSPQDTQDIADKLQRVLLSPSPSTSTSPSPSPSTQGQPPPSAHHIPRPTLVDQHASSSPVLGSSPAHQDACSISSDSHGTTDRRPSMPSLSSVGTGSSSGGDLDPPGQRSLADFSIRDSSHNSEDSGRASDYFGGPFMHHKFDREGKTSSPSWFFEDCSRELAEKILTQCAKHGNTLMRVSWTARNTGSYAISKRLMRTGEIEHYEVIRVAEGYKIGVENCNQTMKTLSEVMEFFIQLSGTTSTLPITCNDLEQLGVDYTDYSRRIVRHDDSSATVPVDSSASIGDNYEVPVGSGRAVALPTSTPQQPPAPPAPPAPVAPPAPCLPKAPFKTWGKDKTEEVIRQSQEHGAVAVKTVGPADRKTVKPDSAKPSVMQIKENLQKQHEQDVVANLEAVIRGEERKLAASKGSSNVGVSDRPPPLPVVPADRPKLCTGGPALYVNTPPTATTALSSPPLATTVKTEGESTAHQRWNKRSQSVPVVTMAPDIDASVPANVIPPPLIKPSAGGSGAGGGGEKTPPPTAPKTVRLPPKASSLDRPDAPTKAMTSVPTRRTSVPICRLRRLHQRWSSRRFAVPLPLPRDYSSEDSSDSPSDSDSDDADICPFPSTDTIDEPRKMSLVELSESRRQSLTSHQDDGSVHHDRATDTGGQPKVGKEECGTDTEADSLSYCQILIQPDPFHDSQRLRARIPSPFRPPESMIYSEIRIGGDWEAPETTIQEPETEAVSQGECGLSQDASEKQSSEMVLQGQDREGKTSSREQLKEGDVSQSRLEDEEVYYLQLLEEEEEVIYDLMYASGKGAIHFWPPPPPSPPPPPPQQQQQRSADPSSTDTLSSIVQELQQKLQPGGAQPLRHVEPEQARSSSGPRGISDLPPPPPAHTVRVEGDEEGEMYEDISQYYQNVPS